MSLERSRQTNYHTFTMFSRPETKEAKGSAETSAKKKEKNKATSLETMSIKYDFTFPKNPSGFDSCTSGEFTRINSLLFDELCCGCRQPLEDFLCCSSDGLKSCLGHKNFEAHDATRQWRTAALNFVEFPLNAANYCGFAYCHVDSAKYKYGNAANFCMDAICCTCICCALRPPIYVLKALCCCFAAAGGKVVDAFHALPYPEAPTRQSMDEIVKLSHEHTFYQLRPASKVKDKKKQPLQVEIAENKKTQEQKQQEQEQQKKDQIAEADYQEKIIKIIKRFLQDENYRDDFSHRDRFGELELSKAVVEYPDEKALSTKERIQMLAYIWERGFSFSCYTQTFFAALNANYQGASLVLEFILQKIDKRFMPKFIENYLNRVIDTHLNDLYEDNQFKACLKADILHKYNITTPRIIELAKEYRQCIGRKTAIEMARYERWGLSSKLFHLPEPLFFKIQEYVGGNMHHVVDGEEHKKAIFSLTKQPGSPQ